MKFSMPTLRAGLAAPVAVLLTMSPVFAQQPAQPAPTRVFGTLESVQGDALVIKTTGGDESVTLPASARITAVAKAELSDIKKGDYVGSATVPGPNGAMRAVEVHIFAPDQHGTGEGSRPFPIVKNGTMTNADVTSTVDDVDGRTLTMTYHGGEKQIVVPKNALIVRFSAGSRSDLVAGQMASATVQAGADGKLTVTRISMGRNGSRLPF